MTDKAAPSQEPSNDQLTQLLNGLDHCNVAGSKRELLRTWIRDYAAAQIAKLEEQITIRTTTNNNLHTIIKERDALIAKLDKELKAQIAGNNVIFEQLMKLKGEK